MQFLLPSMEVFSPNSLQTLAMTLNLDIGKVSFLEELPQWLLYFLLMEFTLQLWGYYVLLKQFIKLNRGKTKHNLSFQSRAFVRQSKLLTVWGHAWDYDWKLPYFWELELECEWISLE